MAVLESLYTPQTVYRPLADALDVARDAEVAHYDRKTCRAGDIHVLHSVRQSSCG